MAARSDIPSRLKFPLYPPQLLAGRHERFLSLGKAETNDTIIAAVGIKHRNRNDRHPHVPRCLLYTSGHAHAHERLCGNLGNIALLGIAAELGLVPPSLTDPVRTIYRDYRRTQHAFRLDGISSSRVERAAYTRQIAAVKALWSTVFV